MSSYATAEKTRAGKYVILGLGAWLAAALAVGSSGIFAVLPGALVCAVVWTLVLGALAAVWHVQAVHEWFLALNLRALLLPHVLRFAGFGLLALYQNGKLPRDFALMGSMADVWIAAAAVALAVWAVPMRQEWQWKAVLTWNILGLTDMLMLIVGGMRFTLSNPELVSDLTAYPMCLLPTFVVPLAIASHILLFDRLRRETSAYAVGA